MTRHEGDIQDIVAEVIDIDYEILDIVLEKQLRNWYKEHRLEFPEQYEQILLNLAWMNYAHWN